MKRLIVAAVLVAALVAAADGFEVIDKFVVTRDLYAAWPTVCLRKNGELLVAYSGLREGHIDPWGTVRIVKSCDGGKTWSEPWTAQNSHTDDRDSGLWELDDGSLLLTWFRTDMWVGREWFKKKPYWERHYRKVRDCLDRDHPWLGWRAFTAKSYDGGKTWTEPAEILGNAPHGGIQLKSGRLMMITRKWAGYKENTLQVEVSDDRGLSWRKLSDIPVPREANGADRNNYHEAHLAEYDDGRILAVFRYHDFACFKPDGTRNHGPVVMRQMESLDGGRTWSAPRHTANGTPPHLLKLQDGRTLLTYGRPAIRCLLSSDDGRTWDTAHEIFLTETYGDEGYPGTVQLPDGTLLTVYYGCATPQEKNSCINAVRWRLK